MIKCQICGQEFSMITNKHLKKHGITFQEYVAQFPNAATKSAEVTAKLKNASAINNSLRKGVSRSEEVKQKIRKTKAEKQAEAWNKGVAMSNEAKQRLSEVKKRQYETGEIVHWNSGRTTSEETKSKISETLKSAERHRTDEARARTADTYAIKKVLGWKKTTSYRQSDERKEQVRLQFAAFTAAKVAEMHVRNLAWLEANEPTLSMVYDENTSRYMLTCKDCGTTFSRTRQAFISSKVTNQAYKCPTCSPRGSSTSTAELEIYEYVKSLIPHAVETGNRTILKGYELDIYVPALNLAVEYCGLYWHSEITGGKEPNYHRHKQEFAYKEGVRLITIFEDEWLNHPEIVKDRLRHILNASSSDIKIGARKCTIKAISNADKDEFLRNNHIQGTDISMIRYGAYYQNQLLAVMTITKSNKAKGGNGEDWELNRFAVASGFHIPGIASKLFKHFVREYNPKEVFSYADRRWSFGNVYHQLGFHYDGKSPESYWYLIDGYSKRVHRFNFRKDTLSGKLDVYDAEKSEWVNMQENGYDRIWDCGTLKYVWTQE